MLKRQIAVLIAAGLLGAQVTVAAAEESAIPPATYDRGQPLPALTKYLEQREAIIRSEATAARGAVTSAFPSQAYNFGEPRMPALTKYLDQRAVSNPNPIGASGTVFSPSAND